MDGNTIAAILGGTATLITAIGGLRWQDRRPTAGDQGRAYSNARRAAARAAKRRAQYDAAVADLDHARAVAEAADIPAGEAPDPDASEQQQALQQMDAYVRRMEAAAASVREAALRSGAQMGRAVATITGSQPAVRQVTPPPPVSDEAWHTDAGQRTDVPRQELDAWRETFLRKQPPQQ